MSAALASLPLPRKTSRVLPGEVLLRVEDAGFLVLAPAEREARTVAAGLAMIGFVKIVALEANGDSAPLSGPGLLRADPRFWRVERGAFVEPRP